MIEVHGWEISQQMVLTGAVVGLSYSAIAAGLILVYRANGIINFAVVAFGSAALGLFGLLYEHGWGLWPCLLVSVPFAALLAMILEVAVIDASLTLRADGGAPRLVLLMATIGIAQLLGFLVLVFAELLPDVPPGGDFPTIVPRDWTWQVTDDLLVGAREISVLIAVPILVVLLALVHDPHTARTDGAGRGVESRQGAARGYLGRRARRRWYGASRPRSPRPRSSCSRRCSS